MFLLSHSSKRVNKRAWVISVVWILTECTYCLVSSMLSMFIWIKICLSISFGEIKEESLLKMPVEDFLGRNWKI